jgi:hypothetical protein
MASGATIGVGKESVRIVPSEISPLEGVMPPLLPLASGVDPASASSARRPGAKASAQRRSKRARFMAANGR